MTRSHRKVFAKCVGRRERCSNEIHVGYDHDTAPAILVPKVGHTIKGPNGIVSRSTKGLDNARDILARNIIELRRVYPDIPNAKLQELIKMNKRLYPEMQ